MRLLRTSRLVQDGSAELVEYVDERSLPKYAVLSHTWGHKDDEVLFEDTKSNQTHVSSVTPAENGELQVKAGWNKVCKAAERARQDGYDFVWIDTCCIDKSSSAELSEAINSMFRWYQKAAVCYVYLVDFELHLGESKIPEKFRHADGRPIEGYVEQLSQCRWFTRGWTLQELIAPKNVQFFDRAWNYVTSKNDIADILNSITGIHTDALIHNITTFASYSIAQRMSWASRRITTRIEDEAYSLLGLFDINMPLLYGEGRKAFRRLQEAIISASTDMSIFAWELLPGTEEEFRYVLFAPSPAYFWWHARDIILLQQSNQHFEDSRLTSQGMHLPLRVHKWRRIRKFQTIFAYLNCVIEKRSSTYQLKQVGLRINNYLSTGESSVLVTCVDTEEASTLEESMPSHRRLVLLENQEDELVDDRIQSVLIQSQPFHPLTYRGLQRAESTLGTVRVRLQLPPVSPEHAFQVVATYPSFQWHAKDEAFIFSMVHGASHGVVVIEIERGLRCIIALGVIHQRQDINSITRLSGRGYLQYWIFPCPRFQAITIGLLRDIAERVSTYAAKDMFEHKATRQCANKIVILPFGDVFRLSAIRSEPNMSQEDSVYNNGPDIPDATISGTFDSISVNLYLRLTVEEVSQTRVTALRDQARVYYDKRESYHRANYVHPLDLATKVPDEGTEKTQAWYFLESIWGDAKFKIRPVNFNAAIFDRKLWTSEKELDSEVVEAGMVNYNDTTQLPAIIVSQIDSTL